MTFFGSLGRSAVRSPFLSQYALSRSPRGQSSCATAALDTALDIARAHASATSEVSGPLSSIRTPPFKRKLFAGVFHAGCGIDLADDAPVFLIGDRHEAILGLELGLQRRA